jgi:hypothetical protein
MNSGTPFLPLKKPSLKIYPFKALLNLRKKKKKLIKIVPLLLSNLKVY